MKTLRLLLILSMLCAVGCSLFKKRNPNGVARTYDGDSSPTITIHEESPGSPLRN